MSDIQKMVDILNEALNADPDAVSKLFSHRIPCGDALADHPEIIVGPSVPEDKNSPPDLGLLGLLNGMARRIHPDHRIVSHYDDNGKLFKFSWREWK
jgi:hypothetical protein